ncbi:DUF305 domain-containing protein [Aquipuribacter nitratireducens]|uniref:DUF305 domain-containing protein n=1 Tax=Aquipuribacter nitratireducens TaxID=650104 RepID=A0ABW0GP26_9MICO
MPRHVLLAAALVLVAAGCGGTTSDAAPPPATIEFTAATDVPVLVPGRPGEPTTTIAPGETGRMENIATWSQDDVDFLTAMVPHHAQALDMAALAPDRAADSRVRSLAERIAAAQGPEIEAMQQWLRANDLPEADEDDHSHDLMKGMASTEQMLALDAARGAEFDALFLELMIAHHEGALDMAADAADSRNVQVNEMVQDTTIKQGVEIARMEELLADLA